MTNRWAPSILARAFSGAAADAIVFSTDVLRLALMATAYTPPADLTAVAVYGDISGSEVAGTGYTAGGITVPTPAMTTTYANSYATTWTAATAYTVGQVVRPATANGHVYMCIVAGTSAATTPTFPVASGQDVVETGGLTWSEIGSSVTRFSSANIVSPSMSLNAVQYGWIYDNTTTNKDLICLLDFGSQKTWTATVVTFTPDANLGWVYLTPS